jgi:hypothetical protein
MRNHLAMAIILLVTFNFAFAQDKQMGLGGSIHVERSYLFLGDIDNSVLTPLIRIPIILSPTFILEPEFGMEQARSKYTSKGSDVESNSTVSFYTFNLYFKLPKQIKSLRLYPGIRIGINYGEMKSKTSNNNPDNETRVRSEHNLVYGLLYGGEYFLSDNFSLGGEAQLNYTRFETEKTSWGEIKSSMIHTCANFIFRWYF